MTDLHDKAKKYALRLLGYRGRSEKELKERLIRKGISKTVASSTVKHLKSVGLINDRILAENLAREALSIKLLSLCGVRKYLINRGIPRDIVSAVLIADEREDINTARMLLDKKMKSHDNIFSANNRRRMYNFLSRRGFSPDTIQTALKEKSTDEEDL